MDRGRVALGSSLVRDHARPAEAAVRASSLVTDLAARPPSERRAELVRHLRERAARILELPDPAAIDVHRALGDLGVDSLMAVELRNDLAAAIGRDLPATLLFDYPTLDGLAGHLASSLFAGEAHAPIAPARTVIANEPIAIIGMACRFPGGADGPEALWAMLADGVEAIGDVPRDRWDVDALFDPDPNAPGKMSTRRGGFLTGVDAFDATFFNIPHREAVRMDPQQRILLEVSWSALEDAVQPPNTLTGTQTGVFVGIGPSTYAAHRTRLDDVDAYTATGNVQSTAVGRISHVLGLEGPSVALDTACSSALVAIHLACQSLRHGDSDLALAGGVNLILSPEATIMFSKARMMAADGRCKTFDARADGYVRSEGCGIVVLKRLSDAVRDGDAIRAVIRGTAMNQDGRSSGLTAPNGPAQQAVIRRALRDGGVAPADVSFVEAHGTGTALGDPIEVQALAAVLGEGRAKDAPIALGSIKTNIGHTEMAAGVAGIIKAVLMLEHGAFPPHLHLRTPNPHIPWGALPVRVPVALEPWPSNAPRRAAVSSFGFSGTNAHAVIEAAPAREPIPAAPGPFLVVLSARTPAALRALAEAHVRHLDAHPSIAIADLAQATRRRRAHLEHRLAAVVDTRDALRRTLERIADGESAEAIVGRAAQAPRVAFAFEDETIDAAVARALHAAEPAFASAIDRLGGLALFDAPGGRTALVAAPIALAALWQSWGVRADVTLARGAGAIAAACVSGALSEADGLARAREGATVEIPAPGGAPPDVVVTMGAGASFRGAGAAWLPSLRRGRDPRETIVAALGAAFVRGVGIDWRAFDRGRPAEHVPLPPPPFERRRYWLELTAAEPAGAAAIESSRSTSRAIGPSTAPWLDAHRIDGRAVVPAAAFFDLALDAADGMALHDVAIEHALLVADAAEAHVTVRIEDRRFAITS
jgi:acyl transferase domain-containing protein/acyl carrier protein